MEAAALNWTGPQISTQQVSFVNSCECPFAQRVWITLLEKGYSFDKHDVDLRDETGQYAPEKRAEWVKRLNPVGKVPILCVRHSDGDQQSIRAVYESTICNELLEDLKPVPSMWLDSTPTNAAWSRAKGRMVIAAFTEMFLPAFYGLLLRQDKAEQEEAAGQLSRACEWLDCHCDADGPYFLGPKFTLVDAALAPFFLRLPALEHYRSFSLPMDCIKLRDCADNIAKRDSVKASCESPKSNMSYDQFLIWVYERYAAGNAKSTSAADYR